MRNFYKKFKSNSLVLSVLTLVVTLVMSIGNVTGQTTVTIGTGTSSTNLAPLNPFYNYNYTQQIYTAAEITAGGGVSGQQITTLRFYYSTAAGTTANLNNWTIYIGNTTQATFTGTTNWVALASMTQVYSGTVTFPAAGNWLEVTLSTPITWTGNNIVVAVDENTAGYASNVTPWRYTSTSANYRTIYYYSDGTNPNPASPPTATGRTYNRPNIQMVFVSPCTGQPNAGTASGTTTGCASTSFTMSTSGLTAGSGISYLWETSADGSTSWTSTGVTTTSLTTSTATTAYYRLKTTCSNSGQVNYTNVVSYTAVSCSSVNVPSTGSNNVACGTSTTIYDHGGSGGNYSSSVSGYTVLENGYTGVINLTGSYITESSYDYLRIYAGVGTGGTLLASYSGTGTITPITSPAGQALTIQFTSDVSAEFAGISLTAIYTGECVEPCVGQITDNTIYANGNADEITVTTGDTFTITSSGGNTSGFCYWIDSGCNSDWDVMAGGNCNMASFNYSFTNVGCYIFHVRNYDGCGYCWDAAHGPNCTCGAGGSDCVVTVNVVPLPGENCSNAQDLSTLTSPYSSTTVGYANDYSIACAGGNTSPDRYFYIDVPYLYTLTIGQTVNGYDSENYAAYGSSCPGSTQLACFDDPDIQNITWTNTTGSTQTVWWIQDGYYDASNSGTFTLAWNLVAPPPYVASYISMNTGAAEWCPGETRTVSVTIQNIGSQAWADGGGEDFNIGVKWNADPDYIVRVDAQNLASGASQTFNLNITAPATAGSENLTFNVVREGISWFGGPYTSAAQTIKPLPTGVSAGSDVTICNGGSTQLSGSATAPNVPTAGSTTFNYSGSGQDDSPVTIGGTISGLPADAVITSITYNSTIGANCNGWYEWDLYVNSGYVTSGCDGTGFTYNGLNGQIANGQNLQLRSYDTDAYSDFVSMLFDVTINYTYLAPGTVNYAWTPTASLDNANIYNPTATPSATTTYTMTATTNGCGVSDNVTVNVSTLSTAPTAVTGTTSICPGGNTTLTTTGGSLGTDATDVWYAGSCGTDIYNQPWTTQPFGTPNSTVNSVSGGILNITSLGVDPMIDMAGLGNFDPNTYKYIQIRYRVTAGTAGGVEIFFYNDTHNFAFGGETGYGSLVSDGAWHIVNVDMSADPEYTTGGLIHGWRFDWCTAAGVTMDIDYISLSDSPIIGEGSSINVSPSVNTTYYTAKRGACNTTACASATVSIYNVFTAGAINTTGETICYSGDPSLIGSTTASSGGDNTITYEWRADGIAIGSTNSATYNPPTGLTATTTYTRWAKDASCSTTFTQSTGSWLVTVRPEFTPGEINTTGETICYDGDPAVIGSTTASSGGDNSITYEWRANGTPIGSSNSATYNPPANLTTTTTYTRWAKDATCNTTFTQSTGSWLVTVRPNFTSGAINTTGETICQGGDPAIIGSTTASSGGDNSITYEWRANGTPIASTNAASYDPPAGLLMNTTYTRWAKDATCNTSFTQSTGSWLVTVTQAPNPTGIAAGDYFWTGVESSIWNNPSNWLYYDGSAYSVATILPSSSSDVFIQSYSGTCALSNAVTTAGTSVYCNDLNIGTGLTLGGLSTIQVRGNWNNSGTFVPGTGTVEFNGIYFQVLEGATAFNNVIFNNTDIADHNINFESPVTINGTATFIDGIVCFNGSGGSGLGSLTFGNSASTIVSSHNSFIDGPISKTGDSDFIFPTGDVVNRDIGDGITRYVVLGAIHVTPSAGTSNISAEFFFDNTGMPDWWEHGGNMDDPLHHVSDRENWIVNSDQNLSNVSLYWYDNGHSNGDICIHGLDDGNPADYTASDLTVAYWSGSAWIDAGGSVSGGHDQGYVTSTGPVPFGAKAPKYITFGSKNNLNPLPVELLSFTADCNDGKTEIEWTTATEINNDYFTLERSVNMIDFEVIAKIEGAGTSNINRDYSYFDKSTSNIVYYRLIQHDFDGKITTYSAIAIKCDGLQNDPSLSVYPNPFNSELTVVIENLQETSADIQILDELGKVVYQQKSNIESANTEIKLDLGNLKPSVYHLRIISDEHVLNEKIVKR